MFPMRYVILGLLSIFLAGGCSKTQGPSADSKAIQIKGSDTMVNLGQAWAEEFMRIHPGANFSVTGGGSGTGIAAIIAGTSDITQSSRDLTTEERDKAAATGAPIKETVVGYDGIAVIVNPANAVTKLTVSQLSDIFTGKIKNWSEVGGKNSPIIILSRERNSGTHIFFLEHVVRKGNAKGPEEYSSAALMMPSSQAIVQEIEGSEVGIGYVGLGYVTKKEKVVEIAKDSTGPYVLPTIDTVQSGTYPISRPLFFFTRGEAQGYVKDFIDFVLGGEGQEIERTLDFVPLKK